MNYLKPYLIHARCFFLSSLVLVVSDVQSTLSWRAHKCMKNKRKEQQVNWKSVKKSHVRSRVPLIARYILLRIKYVFPTIENLILYFLSNYKFILESNIMCERKKQNNKFILLNKTYFHCRYRTSASTLKLTFSFPFLSSCIYWAKQPIIIFQHWEYISAIR